MSDNDFDAELLALAGDDSASDSEHAKPIVKASKSPSPDQPSASGPQKSRPARAQKGVAQRKTTKTARAGTARRRARGDSDEEGQASSPDSLGSGAMSESDDDAASPLPSAAAVDDAPLFPVDGKFHSEKDRAQIMAMPELQREAILAERAAEIERKRQSATLLSLRDQRRAAETKASDLLKKRKAGAAELEESPRKISRAKIKATENLEAYKRQREQRNEQRRRNEDNRKPGQDEPSNENGYSDADAEGDSEVEYDEPTIKTAAAKAESPAELRDFERIRVGRTNFAKVCFYPGFEKAIRGCFCRVNIGVDKASNQNVYRMTQIKGFTSGKPYGMEGPNGRPFHTDQYAIVMQGKAEKEWPFSACSDSKFSDSEFERYKRAMVDESIALPKLSVLRDKCDAIHELLNHRWTNEEIEEKLRRSGVLQLQTAGQQRERLQKEREEAIANGDEATIARVDQELASLEGPKLAFSSSPSNGSTKAPASKPLSQQERLAAINRANRKANQEEIRKAQLAEKRRQQEAAAAVARGEAVANPFARVKTRAKFNFDVNENGSLKVPGNGSIDDLFGDGSDISRAGTPGISTPTKKNGTPVRPAAVGVLGKKKIKSDDILAELDLGIEIDI